MNAQAQKQKPSITILQFICIISGIQIGVAVLSLPGNLVKAAGTDGWIAIIIGWIIAGVAGTVIVMVMKNGQDETILELISRTLGKWAGKLAALLMACYFVLLTFDGLNRTVLITKTWLLPNTSSFTLMVLMLIPSYAVLNNQIIAVGRYVVVIFLMSLWVPFIYLLPLKNGHLLHLLPVIKEGWGPVFIALKALIYPSLGIIAAFFLYPYLKNKKQAVAGMWVSNSITMGLYLFITVICLLFYSPDEFIQYNEPVISMLSSIEFRFVERIEVLFIAFYIFFFSMVWIPCLYLTVECTSWMLGGKKKTLHLQIICVGLAVITYLLKPTFSASDDLQERLMWIGFGFEYVLPVCLLGYLWIYGKFQPRR